MANFNMNLPENIKQEMLTLAAESDLYWAGGPVRDLLLCRPLIDIDIVMDQGAVEAARKFAANVNGTLVVLDEKHGVGRVVAQGCVLDFSQFREGARTIEEDLHKRDITVNAMALRAETAVELIENAPKDIFSAARPLVVDPCGGLSDLENRIIRAISEENLHSDPLRLIRVFRFMAELDFSVADETLASVAKLAPSVIIAAPERITAELTHIMNSRRAGDTFRQMSAASLLQALLPEITEMEGVEQPGFHHLDVLEHCFETLACMDRLVQEPAVKFPEPGPFRKWLSEFRPMIPALKWTAFMHDWGKPAQKGEKDGRVTFYNHDRTGAEMARAVGRRLRWKRDDTDFTALMVEMHMRPFHLLPDFRSGGPSRRALRRLLEKTGPHYPALFMQAMADSMAGCGPLKPEGLDDELAGLAARVHEFYLKRMQPVKKAPRLLTGKDIMDIFHMEPGPEIGVLLRAVEAARIEGEIMDRKGALELVEAMLESRDDSHGPTRTGTD